MYFISAGVLNVICGWFLGNASNTMVSESTVIMLCLVYSACVYGSFVYDILMKFSTFLRIRIFSLEPLIKPILAEQVIDLKDVLVDE